MRTTKRALPLDVDYDSSDDASHQRPTTPSSTTATTSSLSAEEFDPDFTQAVIDTIGPDANPRLRQIMPSLIRHVHDFVRENRITTTEWMAALELLNEAGRMSTDRRNEGLLLCDVIGLESLLDDITHAVETHDLRTTRDATDGPTASAIRGPFWRRHAPRRSMGASIVDTDLGNGDRTYIFGCVRDCRTGQAVDGAELDVWLTAPNGLYEQQDATQQDMNLRGIFRTESDGRYDFYGLRPTSYGIPNDGPAGHLLQLLDRHPMRPAHIHFIVTAPGYQSLTTQIFDRHDPYLDSDAVFAVKASLIVDFIPRYNDPHADLELNYNFTLMPLSSTTGATTPTTATTKTT